MNVDGLLNLERRTGVKDEDIDTFNKKVDDVQAAIKGLLDGTLDPSQVKIDGFETEEEKQQKEIERQARLKVQKEKAEQLRLQRKKEERERWWAGAEMMRTNNSNDELQLHNQSVEEAERLEDSRLRVMSRYTADYSKWSQWAPNDEATRAEEEELQKAADETRNKEFENNNKEFCHQFVEDMQERKKVSEKKQGIADISRLKGNRFFKAKQFDRALELYMEALKDVPFDVKTLSNIAQVQIKLKDYDDAMEFISRTLYLDPKHVKALSRQAFVLGERGDTTAAVSAINRALQLDPSNADLLAQQKELQTIEREKAQEARIAVKSSDHESTAAATTTLSVAGAELSGETKTVDSSCSGDVSSIAQAANALMQLLTASSVDVSIITAECIDSLKDMRRRLSVDSLCKVQLRTSGTLVQLIAFVKSLCAPDALAQCFAESAAAIQRAALVEALLLLADAVDQQRASKILLLEEKLLSALKSVLKEIPLQQLAILHAVVRLLRVCGEDDISVKMQSAVISDKLLLGQLGEWMGNLSFNHCCSHSTTVKASTAVAKPAVAAGNATLLIECVLDCATLIKCAALSEQNRAAVANLDASAGVAVVCGIAAAFYFSFHCNDRNKKQQQQLELLAERLVEAALGVSQIESLRSFFAIDVPFSSESNNGKSICLVSALLQCVKRHPSLCTNAIASLMNACLDSSTATAASSTGESIRTAIVQSGGATLAMSALPLTAAQRQQQCVEVFGGDEAAAGSVFVRKAGLLARLCTVASVQQELLRSDNYRLLCRRISINGTCSIADSTSAVSATATATTASAVAHWQLEERNHYTRVLASLSKPTADCLAIGISEGVLPALLAMLPTPRRECGDITARSVTLMPVDLAPATQLGNTARCLIPYADNVQSAQQLYTQRQLLGVEKIICAMASCSDIRVRKNFAILLAKGCRIAGVRERVTELRGMQMMVELQDKL